MRERRQPRPPGEREGISRLVALLLLGLLAVPFAVLGTLQARWDGPNWDEPLYLTAGLTTLREREIRINFEHPPLVKVLSSVPVLLLTDPIVPTGEAWQRGDQWLAQGDFNEANQAAGTFNRIVLAGRLVPLAIGVGVGFLLYAMTAGLYGRAGGLLAGGLWFTSPFALGLSHHMTIDVPFAAAALLVGLALLRAARRPSWLDPLLVGAACGVALLTRFTGLVLLAAAALSLVLGWRRTGLATAVLRGALAVVVAWACVWGGYRALVPSPPDLPAQLDLPVIVGGAPTEVPLSVRLVTVIPWPEEFDLGVGYLARVSLPPAPGFVMGMAWDGANPFYWPLAMLAKLTPVELGVLAAGVGLLAVNVGRQRREVLLALLLPAGALALFAVVQPRPLGLRYLLSSLLLALVASGWVADWLRERTRGRHVLAAMAVVQVAALVSAHPHSLAWTSPPFRPAYQYVTDSNVDWSLDFYRVQAWSRGRDPWIAFPGPPGYDLADMPGARQLLGADHAQVTGDVAVFVSQLNGYHRDALAWLRGYCPVGTIGGSVLLYHFDEPPDLRPGPIRPEGLCPGAAVSRRTDV